MVTLSTFLQFWGVIFLGTTFFVCFFKTEAEDGEHDKVLGLVDTYKEVRISLGMTTFPCCSCPLLDFSRLTSRVMWKQPTSTNAVGGVFHLGYKYTPGVRTDSNMFAGGS